MKLSTLVLIAAALGAQPTAQALSDFSDLDAWTVKGPGADIKLTPVDTPHGPGMSFDYDLSLIHI